MIISLSVLFVALLFFWLWFKGLWPTSAWALNHIQFVGQANAAARTADIRIGETLVKAELAITPQEKMRGLSGHGPLAANEGMLFFFSSRDRQIFWMKGMKFPLDFIWIDGDRVADLTENVPAPQSLSETLKLYSPMHPVNRVLEVNAGFVAQNQIKVGDLLRVAQ